MTLNERREAARRLLLEDAARSDRLIASLSGLCRETVKTIRLAMIASQEVAQGPCWGRDGKLYRKVGHKQPAPRRVVKLRSRLESVLADLRDPETAELFRDTPPGFARNFGKVSLEVAAAVAKLRRLA